MNVFQYIPNCMYKITSLIMQSYKGHVHKELRNVIWTVIKCSSNQSKLNAQMKIGFIGILLYGLPFKNCLT